MKEPTVALRPPNGGDVVVEIPRAALNDITTFELLRWVHVKRFKNLLDESWKPVFLEICDLGEEVHYRCEWCDDSPDGECCYSAVVPRGGILSNRYHRLVALPGDGRIAHLELGERYAEANRRIEQAVCRVACFEPDMNRLLFKLVRGDLWGDPGAVGSVVRITVNGRLYEHRFTLGRHQVFEKIAWPEDRVVDVVVS